MTGGKSKLKIGKDNKPFRVAYAIDKNNSNNSEGGDGAKKAPKNMYQLFLKFLPHEAGDKDVSEFVAKLSKENNCGLPDHIKICKDKEGWSRGIGFLSYEDQTQAQKALDILHNAPFWEKNIEVSWAMAR